MRHGYGHGKVGESAGSLGLGDKLGVWEELGRFGIGRFWGGKKVCDGWMGRGRDWDWDCMEIAMGRVGVRGEEKKDCGCWVEFLIREVDVVWSGLVWEHMRDKLWDLAHGRRVRMGLGLFDKGFGTDGSID
jgi:hypothetical protein